MTATLLDRVGPVGNDVQGADLGRGDQVDSPPVGLRAVPADAELIRRAARAINPYNNEVRLIEPDNSSVGTVPWSADLSVRPFAVRLAYRNRFVTIGLDFDAKVDGGGRVAFEAEAAAMIFRNAGMTPVTCISGPTGGRHVFVTIGGRGIAPEDARRLVQGLGCLGWRTLDQSPMRNPTEGVLRPPFAQHRLGGRSEVLGMVDEAAIAALEERADPDDVLTVIDAVARLVHQRQRLSKGHVPRLGVNGVTDGYPSGSEAAAALAARVVNECGDDFAEFEKALGQVPRASQLGEHLAERGRDAAYLSRTFSNAVTFVREHPARGGLHADRRVLDDWPEGLASIDLNDSQLAAAKALLAAARTYRRTLTGMSARELALLTGVSSATAARALAGLLDRGLVEVAGEAPGAARRYRLRHPDDWEVPAGETVSPSLTGGVGSLTVSIAGTPFDRLASDDDLLIWSRIGLGKAANHVYRTLVTAAHDEGEARRAAIAEQAHLSGSQVDAMLARLGEHGLAKKIGRGRWVPLAPPIVEVIESLGIADATAERAERFNRDAVSDKVRWIKHMVNRAVETAA